MRPRSVIWVLVICLLFSLYGCSTSREQRPAVHPVSLSLTHRAGSVLSAAMDSAGMDLGNAPGLTVEAMSLMKAPQDALKPLSSYSSLVTAVGPEVTFLSVPAGLSAVRLGAGSEVQSLRSAALSGGFGTPWQIGPYEGVLSPDVCVQLDVQDPAAEDQSMSIVLRSTDAAGSKMQVAITARHAGKEAAASLSETAIAELPFTDTNGIAIVAPLPQSGAVLIIVDRREIAPGELANLRTVAAKQITESAQRPAVISPERLMWESATAAMQDESSRRSSLVSLATRLQAPICLDLALSADDAALAQFCANLPRPDWQKATPGWDLDKASFDFLGKLLVAGKLTPELSAVLATHAGEAGHSTLSMEQLIGKATSRKDLENRLVAENYIQLEEVSPAARVRAFDWLKARGKAPAGYDPLGSANARRAAMNAAVEAMTASAGGKQQ